MGVVGVLNLVSLSKYGPNFVFFLLLMYSSLGTAAICLHFAGQEFVTNMSSFTYTQLCIISCL